MPFSQNHFSMQINIKLTIFSKLQLKLSEFPLPFTTETPFLDPGEYPQILKYPLVPPCVSPRRAAPKTTSLATSLSDRGPRARGSGAASIFDDGEIISSKNATRNSTRISMSIHINPYKSFKSSSIFQMQMFQDGYRLSKLPYGFPLVLPPQIAPRC